MKKILILALILMLNRLSVDPYITSCDYKISCDHMMLSDHMMSDDIMVLGPAFLMQS